MGMWRAGVHCAGPASQLIDSITAAIRRPVVSTVPMAMGADFLDLDLKKIVSKLRKNLKVKNIPNE
jgi:hypothetical protein